MLYDYLKTAFNLIVGIVTNDVLVISAIVLFFLIALWIVLSLVYSQELIISKNCKKLSEFIDKNGITPENEAQVIALASKMPRTFLQEFKMWKFLGGKLAGRFFTEQACISGPVYGGIYNQNRSVMKSVINGFVILMFMLSLALLGAEENLTGLAIAEASIIPLLSLLFYKTEYYVYTSIRQYFYRQAEENFSDLIDVLNEKYELGQIKFDTSFDTNLNLEPNTTTENLIEKDENLPMIKIENAPLQEVKRGRGRPRKTEEEKNTPLTIENDADFEKALARAEKLMTRLHKPLSDSQKRRTNKELAEIMDVLSQYKKRKNK